MSVFVGVEVIVGLTVAVGEGEGVLVGIGVFVGEVSTVTAELHPISIQKTDIVINIPTCFIAFILSDIHFVCPTTT